MEQQFVFPPESERVRDAIQDFFFAHSRLRKDCDEWRQWFDRLAKRENTAPRELDLERLLAAGNSRFEEKQSRLLKQLHASANHFWQAKSEFEQALDGLPQEIVRKLEGLGNASWIARQRMVLDRIVEWYRYSQPAILDDVYYLPDYGRILAKLIEQPAPDPSDELAKLQTAMDELYSLRTGNPATKTITMNQPAEVIREPSQLLDGPVTVELSPHEMALLEAYLKQPGNRPTLRELSDRSNGRGESDRLRKLSKLTLIRNFNRELKRTNTPATVPPVAPEIPVEPTLEPPAKDEAKAPTKKKRSTQKGDGREKLISALTKHHQYADGSCLKMDPIGNNELARMVGVANRTASAFFKKFFKGHSKYCVLCNDPHRLVAAIKALNGEFRPSDFYSPPASNVAEQEDE